ncbi:biotin/lipoyl-binding carrier protein [Acidovorax facilis]|jgi:acetyl-CoA carboxylase biotin carboxyl carrier protein|uniref:biotin/lipoyl-binding carrier protein n=1 Tax=Acidovorax facilis TaxID=12917 RepID=UPI003D64C715
MSSLKVLSPLTGSVWKIEVQPGTHVAEGDVLMVLESMKMEIPVEAPQAGVVQELNVQEGDTVQEDQLLASLGAA